MNYQIFTKKDSQNILKIAPGTVISDRETDRVSYSGDLSPFYLIKKSKLDGQLPAAIIWPKTKQHLVKIIKYLSENRIVTIPFGAGSGVCGGTIPFLGGVIIDMKELKNIIELDEISQSVTVETGIIGQHLEEYLNTKGFTLSHFPSSIYCSTLGGYLATRSAGQLSTKYGKIEDMVSAIEVVTPKGEIIQTKNTPRAATGPDFKQLFIGSEGTLGMISRATLKIKKIPDARLFQSAEFPSFREGIEAIRTIMQKGILPACLRIYDELDTLIAFSDKSHDLEGALKFSILSFAKKGILSQAKKHLLSNPSLLKKMLPLLPKKVIMIMAFEGTYGLSARELEESEAIIKEMGGDILGPTIAKNWWNSRYSISYKQSPVFSQGGFVDTMEISIPWSKVFDAYREIKKAIMQDAIVMAHLSHFYPDGAAIYFTFALQCKEEEMAEVHKRIWQNGLKACVNVGASISHHHGIGYLKKDFMKDELGPMLDIFRAIKKHLDPANIMNPGKLGL